MWLHATAAHSISLNDGGGIPRPPGHGGAQGYFCGCAGTISLELVLGTTDELVPSESGRSVLVQKAPELGGSRTS